MCDISNLYELCIGERAHVISIFSNDGMRRRLLDLGLTPHAKIECVGESPAGDPRAYLIRGAVIAIRNIDSHNIIIKHESQEVI